MARWLRIVAMLSTIAAFVGALQALVAVWTSSSDYCAAHACDFNGLYLPPPPPRTHTIGLIIGPTLPFGVYWIAFVVFLAIFAGTIWAARLRPTLMLAVSVLAIGALALLVADARLPLSYSWDNADTLCGSYCATQHWMHSEWLFLWCLVPCCVAVFEQFLSTRLPGPHPLPPSPTGEGKPNVSAVEP